MKLTVLGKYGPFSVNGGSTSGYLLESNGDYAVMDLGSGTLTKLLKRIDINELNFVYLSHLHFDHIADVGILSYAVSFLKKDKKLKVYYHDDGSDVSKVLKNIAVFELVNVKENQIYNEGNLVFSFYKMTHPVDSFGIKISDGGKTLAYTGDTTYNENILNLINGVDFLLADGAFLEKDYAENKLHMSIKQVNDISLKYQLKTLVTHISFNYKDSDVYKELKKNKLIKVAKENKTYKL
ncbi:MAG: MBL fold metallo-hydrolase [Clostridia bacterium]|nr:MBL fold metallo-hydrolase [Clostridia bacterium]